MIWIDWMSLKLSKVRTNKISPPKIKVLYGRPKKNGREIFGNVIPYGKIWRVGANEATEVIFYNDVVFGETEVKAGTYVLYAIPDQDEFPFPSLNYPFFYHSLLCTIRSYIIKINTYIGI